MWLQLHPLWLEYLQRNYQIVTSWAELNWAQFLQRRNPNTPAITNKIYPPLEREPLTSQRKFWDDYITAHGLKCIFSGKELAPGNYELDHFVPWSYVGHDQHWNLIPIDASTNSSKNNALPDKSYIALFSAIQKSALGYALAKNKKSVIEDHMVGLQCSQSDLLNNSTTMEQRLTKTIESLIDMAELQGFEGGWTSY